MEKKPKPTLASFVWAAYENLDYVEKQLDILTLPDEIRDSLRYAIKRALGRCKGMDRHAAKLEMMLGLESELPDGLYVDPPVLQRDVVLFQNLFMEQIRELKGMIWQLEGIYDPSVVSNDLKDLNLLLYETQGYLYYLLVRARHLIASSIADLSEAVVS